MTTPRRSKRERDNELIATLLAGAVVGLGVMLIHLAVREWIPIEEMGELLELAALSPAAAFKWLKDQIEHLLGSHGADPVTLRPELPTKPFWQVVVYAFGFIAATNSAIFVVGGILFALDDPGVKVVAAGIGALVCLLLYYRTGDWIGRSLSGGWIVAIGASTSASLLAVGALAGLIVGAEAQAAVESLVGAPLLAATVAILLNSAAAVGLGALHAAPLKDFYDLAYFVRKLGGENRGNVHEYVVHLQNVYLGIQTVPPPPPPAVDSAPQPARQTVVGGGSLQPAPGRPSVVLTGIGGSARGVRIPIDKAEFTIGSGPSNHFRVIGDTSVSNHHLAIRHTNGRVYAVDRNSTNGTLCNDRVLKNETTEIRPGDRIRIGETTFMVEATSS